MGPCSRAIRTNDAVVHEATHNAQHFAIEVELRRETRWLESHGEEMAMRAAIRRPAAREMGEQTRPERVPARIDQRSWEVAA
jgi:hypothetical protein